MIYIITGIPKSGKTTIAKEFIKRYKIPYFSTDYIMMMLSRGNPELRIDPNIGDSIVSKQIKPYVYAMIKTMIENKVDYLIEGVHFSPLFAKELLVEYPNDIQVTYLGYKDTSVIYKIHELNKYKDELENPWYSSHSDEDMVNLVSHLIDRSERTYNLCKVNNLKYIEIYDLMTQIDEVIGTFNVLEKSDE